VPASAERVGFCGDCTGGRGQHRRLDASTGATPITPEANMHYSRRILASALALLALATTTLPATAAPVAADTLQVIVVLRDAPGSVAAQARATAADHRAEIAGVYGHALRGFAASVSSDRITQLRRDPRVAYVELDQTVELATTPDTGVRRTFAAANPLIPTGQAGDRLGEVDVDIAILDTGVAALSDLNLVELVDCTSGTCVANNPARGNDVHGHGTHVAGTAAGRVNATSAIGMAPGARLHGVKVLADDGKGTWASVIAGLNHVAANASVIEVANLSLAGGYSQATNDAVANLVARGVVSVVAAGNSSVDVSTVSPASAPQAITVSALSDYDGLEGGIASATCRIGTDDTLASFSNFGTLVDLAAPGVCITSLYPDGSYRRISGTSMAAPHVAGAAALLASRGGTTPAGIDATLKAKGNLNWTDTSGDGVRERLLDVRDTTTFSPRLVGDILEQPATPSISLSGRGFIQGRNRRVELTWSSETVTTVRIFRNNRAVATNSTGTYLETVKAGTYTYKVCSSLDASLCSNEVRITI
jgi:subtilisin family serine protease